MKGAEIRLENVTLGYDRHPAVHHLTGRFAAGSLTALVGPNGAGKSTLVKGIAGILTPLGGAIDLGAAARRRIAYLPQAAEIDRSFPIGVYDFIAMGLWRRCGILGSVGRGERERVSSALEAVGLAGFETRPIGTLSGGQMQRVLFARLLLQDAPIVLLDEPFTAIDQRTAADLLGVVERWHGEGRTVIAVLHDIETVRQHFPETLLIARERIAWGPTREALSGENLLAARRMVEAFDPAAGLCAREVA